MQRTIDKKINAQATSDGDGVKISRSIGSRALSEVDPFLLLDELRSDDAADYIGGFPSHPHRGFETVTYMLEGQMRHKDSAGNEGVIRAGDIQWMTAGSGIVHSEMPEQTEGRLWGFQFWINLPAAQKMRAPRYQEIAAENIPEVALEGGKVRVLAGEVNTPDGVVQVAASDIATQPLLLDVQLDSGEWIGQIPTDHEALLYVYRGELNVGGASVQQQQLARLSAGDSLHLVAEKSFGALVLAAAHINEPIARSGPFVMNTQEELQQAFSDFRSGNFAQ
ncbi:MAG: redox-sensitive bicupin YhaK (pirin superfamily) [Kiritimatiellia bacterium]|jgi:redox-sensitive bicupin YhaK (pirin superfamily)